MDNKLLLNKINTIIHKLYTDDQNQRNKFKLFISTNSKLSHEQIIDLWCKQHNRKHDNIFNDKLRLDKFTLLFNKVIKQNSDIFKSFDSNLWHQFWLLTQHCDNNIEFQKEILQIIKQNLSDESDQYKYLYDRVAINSGRKQKYGTQNEV